MRGVYDFGTALQLKQVHEEQLVRRSKPLDSLLSHSVQSNNRSGENKGRLAARALVMRHPKRNRMFPWIDVLFPCHPSLYTLGRRVAGWWADLKLNLQLARLVGVDPIADMRLTESTEQQLPPRDWKIAFLTCDPDRLRVVSENGGTEE